MSALIEFDHQGEVIAQEFCSGVIRSRERMTYTQVHALLEGDANEELKQRYAPLQPRFELMKQLALVLNRKRTRRGSIDFDLPEPLIEFDEFGQMTGVSRSPRNIAHRLIEEFMLAANEAVAAHIQNAAWPGVYRIHETPSPQKVAEFEQIAGMYGLSLTGGRGPTAKKHHQVTRARDGRKIRRDIVVADQADFQIEPKAYQRLVAKLEGRPEERILSYLMLRSLKQARYSPYNTGHFALAADNYTHFTSPIRRYPDLLIHRILRELLEGRRPPYSNDELEALTDQASLAERRASEAERELVEWKKAKFMQDHVGDEFDGMVISVTRFGFFVELDRLFVEGLVALESLHGDRYLFQENQRKLIGERTRRAISIGDPVRVRLDRVDAVEGRLHFSLANEPGTRRPRR
jgi:ribonuclease R